MLCLIKHDTNSKYRCKCVEKPLKCDSFSNWIWFNIICYKRRILTQGTCSLWNNHETKDCLDSSHKRYKYKNCECQEKSDKNWSLPAKFIENISTENTWNQIEWHTIKDQQWNCRECLLRCLMIVFFEEENHKEKAKWWNCHVGKECQIHS